MRPKANILPAKAEVSAMDRLFAAKLSIGTLVDHLANHLIGRDRRKVHGNGNIRDGQLLMAHILAFLDPLCRSPRLFEDQGNFDGRLELARLARSTHSDDLAACDPGLLLPMIADLHRRIDWTKVAGGDLPGIVQRILILDSTYFTLMADTLWALTHTKSDGKTQAPTRVAVELDSDVLLPGVIVVAGDDGIAEPASCIPGLLGGTLYVTDGNFGNIEYFSAVIAKGSGFVVRAERDSPAVAVERELPLSAADIEAGVVADELAGVHGHGAPAGMFRRVTIHRIDREGKADIIRLLTTLVDPSVSAATIGEVHRRRWEIETFFKWLKGCVKLDHLLSRSREGIEFQLYMAVIGVLLMHLQTGERLSKYAYAVFHWIATGRMGMEEGASVILKRDRERAMERERQARNRASKKSGL